MLSSLYLPRSKAVVALFLAGALSSVVMLSVPSRYWLEGALLSSALSWASVVDLDRRILPNALTIGLVAAGILFGMIAGEPPLLEQSLGAVLGYASLTAIAYAYRQFRRRDGLGQGDAKLFAATGAWVGWSLLPGVMLVASVAALLFVVGRRISKSIANEMIAFGPFISLGAWAIWLMKAAGWHTPA